MPGRDISPAVRYEYDAPLRSLPEAEGFLITRSRSKVDRTSCRCLREASSSAPAARHTW